MLLDKQRPYLLMTPGPLTTSDTVKQAMWYDSCTWDVDYKRVVNDIRSTLLNIAACDPVEYTTVLMQGSGTFGVESVLGSSINPIKDKALILDNGVYGKRIIKIANILNLPYVTYEVPEDQTYNDAEIRQMLAADPAITHIVMVHCETTTGLLNDLAPVAALAKEFKKYFIVDAMSSFAGMAIDVVGLNIDFLVSSANKCIQGVPGFSFVICKKDTLQQTCEGNAKSLVLDLYAQWQEMETKDGKFRFTSPTHTVLGFAQALKELAAEGGIEIRATRYRHNQRALVAGLAKLGFAAYIRPELQSSIITTFLEPEYIPGTQTPFRFADFYQYLKSHGFVIYPGKLAAKPSFRIGTIGHMFTADIEAFLQQVQGFIMSHMAQQQKVSTHG